MNKKRVRVLFIAQNIPVPGIYSSRVIIEIAKRISSFAEVTFLYPKEKVPPGLHLLKKYRHIYKLKSWNCEGYDIGIYPYIRIPFKSFSYRFWNKLSKTGRTFAENNGPYDIIHAHYLLPDGFLAYLFSIYHSIPYIITVRNADIKLLKKLSVSSHDFRKAELVIRNASQVLSMNSAYKELIDKMFGINSIIIPHGLADNIYAPDNKTDTKRVSITTIAEAIKRKNIGWVIDAFRSYSGEKKIELNIIGDGPLLSDLKKSVIHDDRVNFSGRLSKEEVLVKLRQSDIFALPSYDETFGMVYLEAAANYNAIIGLKHEGVWGIFEEEKEMKFCRDEKDFQQLLHSLIDNDKQRIEMANSAFKRARELNWANISKQYEKLYQGVIDGYFEM